MGRCSMGGSQASDKPGETQCPLNKFQGGEKKKEVVIVLVIKVGASTVVVLPVSHANRWSAWAGDETEGGAFAYQPAAAGGKTGAVLTAAPSNREERQRQHLLYCQSCSLPL